MPKRLLTTFAVLLFTRIPCLAYTVLETEDFVLSMDTYLREDLVVFKNITDLDNQNKDDATTYFGIDYSLGLGYERKDNGPRFYLKLERNGPFDYDAPLLAHNTLMTTGGVIEEYRNDELLPQLEEFWLDVSVAEALRFKAGLYTYTAGNGFSLNGAYENYGLTIYKEWDNCIARVYYCRPDLVYKNHLGPRIRQEQEQGIVYEHNAANFLAADIKFDIGRVSYQPYIGVLVDYTSSGKRDNAFATPTKRDILGTLGLSYEIKQADLSFRAEAAHNFGRAESSDVAYKDVYHTGYLFYAGLDYQLHKFTPSFQFLLCSGNKVTLETAKNQETALTSGKNRAFSYYSPLNRNLGDSINSSNVDMLPIVAMGGGYGLNYGIPRPSTFSAADFNNIILPSLGFDFSAAKNLSIGLYGYYLMAFVRPVGTLNGQGKYLSRDLGYEADLFVDYRLNENTLVSILGGYFLPGRYYKEERDDTAGSLFNAFTRGDGNIDFAYQVELAMEFKF